MERARLTNQLLSHGNELAEFLSLRLPPRYQSTVSTEDVLQDVWESAFRADPLSIPDNPQRFRNWLLTVARRQLIDALKAARALKRGGGNVLGQQLRKVESSLLDLFNIVAAPQFTPSGEISVRETTESIRRALLERLIPDRIALPLGALCNRLAEGDRADKQRMSLRDALTCSVAEAIRSAVRPLEDRVLAQVAPYIHPATSNL